MTLNDKIKALCELKKLTFKPWQHPEPWGVQGGDECPYPPSSAGAEWWPKMMQIRAELIKEINADGVSGYDTDIGLDGWPATNNGGN